MGFKCGIVGLPNVGKSTLFNALTISKKAQAENFPFCTIDPNVGIVAVPDERLNKISTISKSLKTINAAITFVDIAGLVKGASKGEGLGNKFLSHVREVDTIIHLTRCFDSDKIQNVNKDVNPIRDLEIIETEILLSDLESLQKRLEKNNKKKLEKDEMIFLEECHKLISDGKKPDELNIKYGKELMKKSALLSVKPRIIVCNVDEKSLPNGNKYSDECKKKFPEDNIIVVCADIEDQIMGLQPNDRKDFMIESGIKNTGLDNLIKTGYDTLGLSTFFTSGPEESRAWTIEKKSKAADAAGVIHTDFKKKFIRAETVTHEDFIKYKGFNECKNVGKLRLEGKDYLVNDGDVMYFRVGS
ncbi:redox-regulated ATPase YchF [Pelagibacteraceae bacterium]|jgi:ribosome-binding ATPase|nr:redox-regulated ATPase YchF [Pelagibacteraceae bacterium]